MGLHGAIDNGSCFSVGRGSERAFGGLNSLAIDCALLERSSLLVGLNGDKVHCYDLEEKKLLRSVELGGRARCIAPLDSKRVALGGGDGRLYVMNVTNGGIEKKMTIGARTL